MSRTLTILLFLFFTSFSSQSQVLPKEGSKLNYRLVGFSVPSVQGANEYILEIAKGNFFNADSFKKNIVFTGNKTGNKIIGEVPSFGEKYTWRIRCNGRNKSVASVPLHHFCTQSNPRVDTTGQRLRILQSGTGYKDNYVAIDGGGVLYDMSGNPVWFIPDANGLGGFVSDIKFTPQGTITFILGRDAFEINYNGDVLWKAPRHNNVNGDTSADSYHHEFVRLSNGHYMLLGREFLMCSYECSKDSCRAVVANDKVKRPGYKKGSFGTIIDFDETGNVVWSWKTSKYLLGADLAYYTSTLDSGAKFDPHDNCFFFDEKNKVIYLGFRNINRVIKIAYPDGKVLGTYGAAFKPGTVETGSRIFCNQHGVRLSEDRYLYFFNNNSCCNTDSLPAIVMLQEPATPKDSLKIVWQYTCTMEGDYPKKFTSGGNVLELPDHSLLVCMGTDYSKLFIVNRDKEILWSALPERYMDDKKKWAPVRQYRTNIISRIDLEKIIWNTEAGEPKE